MRASQFSTKLGMALFLLGIILQSFAQCPEREYFYSAETEVPWASCYVYQKGGSRTKIPFLPAVYDKMAPFGTFCFTQDLALDLKIIFAGDGKVLDPDYNPYNDIDASGKAVLICTNFPDTLNKETKSKISINDCLNQAVNHGAKALIIADFNQVPFSYKMSQEYVDAEIPVIVIDKKGVYKILQSAGQHPEELFNLWKSTGRFTSQELICNIKIDMQGKFNHLMKSNFNYYYPDGNFNPQYIEALSDENDKAVDFLFGLYKEIGLKWHKTMIVYFPGYDIKSFYTLHCGRGLANEKGVFIVLDTTRKEFGLIVHENTHKLFSDNMGENTSFISEGIAMYAQAEATNKMENHISALNFLKQNKLFPLEIMMDFNIGQIPEETAVGYPASGSFTGFIIDVYGMNKYKKLYMHKYVSSPDRIARWQTVYGKTIKDLESEWHGWLLSNVSFPGK